MRWEDLSGSLWILWYGREKVAIVSLMCSTGGYTGCLYPPQSGSNLGRFRTLAEAQAACEAAAIPRTEMVQ